MSRGTPRHAHLTDCVPFIQSGFWSCRPALTIFFGPWPSRHLKIITILKRRNGTNWGCTRKSPEPFSASGWLPVRIALPDHCRRGWAPINQRAHIILLWELISVSRSAHFRFATSGLSKHPRTMCTVLSQVVSCHGGLLFMSLLRNHQRTHWNIEITLCHAC